MTTWTDHLPINEHFGPVAQGEGPYTGRRCSFIRLGRCNLHCPQCDTKPTWDTSQYDLNQTCPPTPISDVIDATVHRDTPIVVISGGEPLLWQNTPAWESLLRGLLTHARRPLQIHVETNGTITPNSVNTWAVAHFSVSPKLRTMGGADSEKKRIKPHALAAFAELASVSTACLKIVCATADDVTEAATFADAHGFARRDLWIMPEGDTHETASTTAARIGDRAIQLGANFSPRLHLMMGIR